MMGKGPNGEWGLSQNVGLDLAVTSKAPFLEMSPPWALPCTYPNLLPLLCKISHCCKSLDFYFCKFNEILKIFQILKNRSSRYSKYIKIFLKLFVYPNWLWMITTLATSQNRRQKNKKKTKLIPTAGLEDFIVYGNQNKFITQLVSGLSVPFFCTMYLSCWEML
jgi:hypothetical protein